MVLKHYFLCFISMFIIAASIYYSFDFGSESSGKRYSYSEKVYDNNEKLIEERYYNVDGRSEKQPLGYFAVKYSYPKLNEIKITYLDENGYPTINSLGYATV